MAAQPRYMLLHQTNANPGVNTTSTTAPNNPTTYYQARSNELGETTAAATTTPYITYGNSSSGTGVANVAYHRTQGNQQQYQAVYSNVPTTATTTTGVRSSSGGSSIPVVKPPMFRAPAHKHAHHLHSIPPREKSTRTLIIDHMLWVHGRTRFAQARAELGMTDRTGGPSSFNYAHRTRPENYEEEDEVGSDGEEPSVLQARGAIADRSEEARLSKQDLPLARTLRLRAEGLEKVVTSMLDQPPPVPHRPPPDDYNHHHHYHHHHHHSHSHWQKYETSPNTRTGRHHHTLPNGVRLRLALGTIINDLFARQAPHPPYRHIHAPAIEQSVTETPPHRDETLPPTTTTLSRDNLPEALLPLTRISGVFASRHESDHQRSPSNRSMLSYGSSSPYQSFNDTSPGPVHQYQAQQPQYQHHVTTGPSPFIVPGSQLYTSVQQPQQRQTTPRPRGPVSRPVPSQRATSLYTTGADPLPHTSPPASRCPRHLQTGCEICVEAKVPTTRGAGGGSRAFIVPSTSASGSGAAFSSYGRSSGGARGGAGAGGPASGITGWKDGSGMGTGLLKPSLSGSVLRRKVYLGTEEHLHHSSASTPNSGTSDPSDDGSAFCKVTGAGNTKLSRLIPRFIKLSALVAGELGREVRGEEVDESSSSSGGESEEEEEGPVSSQQAYHASAAASASTSTPSTSTLQGGHAHQNPLLSANESTAQASSGRSALASPYTSRQRQHQKMYEYALRPTREWYTLLAALLTRAVLEGYLTAGWRGMEAVECLLLLGLGIEAEDLSIGEGDDVGIDDEDLDGDTDQDGLDGDAKEEGLDVKQEGGGEEGEDEKEARKKREKAKKWRKRRKALEMFDEDEEFSEFHPDEYPSLLEAVRVLFPSLRNGTAASRGRRKGKGKAEVEYEAEMFERLRRFYDIPASTPDLATHMEDLVWQYPAEPVERAVVRFCEGVARWRGKPELETYKTKPAPKTTTSSAAASGLASFGAASSALSVTDPLHQLFSTEPLSIESLVHSNPTSPTLTQTHPRMSTGLGRSAGVGFGSGSGTARKQSSRPSVDVYFAAARETGDSWGGVQGRSSASVSPSASKRRRGEEDVGGEGLGKRVHL